MNFLLAEVRGALGPYLDVFLVIQQHWRQTEVGWVTTVGGLLGLLVQMPTGGAIDATRSKQGAVATVQGVGASLSGLVAGVVVDHFGYSAVFLTSCAVACAALATLFLAMPETATGRTGDALAARGRRSRLRQSGSN